MSIPKPDFHHGLLGHLCLLAKAHGRPGRFSPHGYMKRVYAFAPHGAGHPAVSVNRRSLTLYLGPHEKRSIQRIADVPEDIFVGPQA